MRTIFEIALNDLRIIFKEKGIWINIAVLPIVISLAVGLANGALVSSEAPTAPTIIVDVVRYDGDSERANAFMQAISAANPAILICDDNQAQNEACKLNNAMLDEPLAQERLLDSVSLGLIIIPANFEAQLDAGTPTTIVFRSNEAANAPSIIRVAIDSAAQQIGGSTIAGQAGRQVAQALNLGLGEASAIDGFSTTVRDNAASLWAQPLITVTYGETQFDQQATINSRGGGFQQSIPGMATMYVMFAVLPATGVFILERQQWTLQRLATMPITRSQIMGGKMLARFVIGMIQYAIMFAFGLLIGVRFGGNPLAILLVMVCYTLCITALALALTGVLKNAQQANAVAQLLTLTLAPLGGAWWPLEIVPGWMQTVGHISPMAWAMNSYRDLIFYNGDIITILPALGVLLAASAALFAFGVARFQVD